MLRETVRQLESFALNTSCRHDHDFVHYSHACTAHYQSLFDEVAAPYID